MATPELALIPTGYKAGKVYSVLPETGVGDFAFTRASAATRINSAGLLEVPQYSIGSDVVTNGSFATDSDWNLLAGWTISGGKANALSLSGVSMNQDVGITVGKTYKITYTISEYVSGSYKSIVGGASQGSARSSNGTFTDYINAATGSNGRLYLQGNGGFTGSIDNVSVIEWAINDVPRLEYPLIDGVVNGCPSLLLENQATNLITYPISFGNSYWTKSGATIEGDPSTAGSELVTNGDFATDTDWTKGTGWTIGGGVASCDGTQTSSTQLTQSGTYTINKMYKITYTVIVTTGSIDVRFQGGGATVVGANRTTSGTYTDYLTSTGNASFRFRVLADFIGSVDNVSVKEVQGYSSPSVDFPTSGFKLVEGTSTASHRTSSPQALTNNIYSIYAKADERGWILLTSTDTSSPEVRGQFFDIANGVIGTGGDATINAKIEALANGWYRCSIDEGTNPSTRYAVMLATGDGTYSYTGDGTSGVYLFMAQSEQGSVATSPTLTSLSAEGTTTTRVAETCNGAGDASTFNDSEGVLMAEISFPAQTTSSNLRIAISDTTANNRVLIQNISAFENRLQFYVIVGGVTSTDVNLDINDIATLNKIVFKYKENDFSVWINGFEVLTDTSGITFPNGTLTELAFDGGDGGFDFYGKTKQIQYFNTVLTSAELETLTSWTSFISMANAQQYNII